MKEARINRYTQIVILASVYLLLHCPVAFAQESHHEHEEHNHHIGFLVGPVYNTTEKSFSPGIGVEYERLLPFWDHLLGIGVGAEAIFDEHKHYVVFMMFPFHPTRELTLKFAPGMMFIDKEGWESHLAVHFGISYEFELNSFFLAPAFEIGAAGDDVHLMLGLHFGWGF